MSKSLINLPEFSFVKGIVVGRFEEKSEMTNGKFIKIIKTKKELDNIPVVANVDFGHTEPRITFPVGGEVSLKIAKEDPQITIVKH